MDAFTAEQQQAARHQAARRQAEQPQPPLVCCPAASRWLREHFCPMLPESFLVDGKLPVTVAVGPTTGGMNVLHVVADYLRDASRKIERDGPSAARDFQIPLNAILAIPGLKELVNDVPGSGHIHDRSPYRRRPFF